MQLNYRNDLQTNKQTNIMKWTEDYTDCDKTPYFSHFKQHGAYESHQMDYRGKKRVWFKNKLSYRISLVISATWGFHWALIPDLLWLAGDRDWDSELISLENYICFIRNRTMVMPLPNWYHLLGLLTFLLLNIRTV